MTQLSKQEFRQIHSHAIDCTNISAETNKLIDKSREFAFIAVSNYNNPQFKYKTYSFIVDMVIAYTALFHAIFEKNKTEYFYKDQSGNFKLIDGEKKAFELKKILSCISSRTTNGIKIKFRIFNRIKEQN